MRAHSRICAHQRGGSCGGGGGCDCKGGGGSCGGKPTGGCGDKPSGGCGGKPSDGGGSPGGGSGQLPLIPDYDGEIWGQVLSYRVVNGSYAGASAEDYFCCNVHGVWKCGYKHKSRNAVCYDVEQELCEECDAWQPPPCPPYCLDMKQRCDAAERECNTACILIFDERQWRMCFNSCIAPAMSGGGACDACKTCHGAFPSCPACVTSYWGLPPLPLLRDPNYDPGKDWCSDRVLNQEDVGDDANYCCFLHDKCYEKGGHAADKLKCDLDLASCLWGAWGPFLGAAGGFVYFAAVSVAGSSHFNWHESMPGATPMQDAFGSPWGHMR